MAVGTPMLLAGDEVRRTPAGNNNAYCPRQRVDVVRLDAARKICRGLSIYQASHQISSEPESAAERFDMTLRKLLLGQPIQWHGVRTELSRLE